jgi:hypothetical protein
MTSDALRIKYSDPVDPWEMLDTPWGHMPAWKAATYATGTTEAAMRALEQVRNDSATIVARQDAREASLNTRQDALDQREREVGVMAVKVAEMAGRMSVEWDKLQKAKADAAEGPLATPPGTDADPGDPSKEPEPSLELEGDNIPGTEDPDDPSAKEDQPEFPDPELPTPLAVETPIAAGLDKTT